MAGARLQPSSAFANREFNGEGLIDELAELRSAQVSTRQLFDLVGALRSLQGTAPAEATRLLKGLATGRFAVAPTLAALLVRWSSRLKSEMDVPMLVSHFERLALVAALVPALRRGSERLPKGGRA